MGQLNLPNGATVYLDTARVIYSIERPMRFMLQLPSILLHSIFDQ
jgi:hypothetical protein